MQSINRLAVSSITYAMQARELLSRHGIAANIVRLHPTETPNGCAFAIEVADPMFQSARILLKRAEIKYTEM